MLEDKFSLGICPLAGVCTTPFVKNSCTDNKYLECADYRQLYKKWEKTSRPGY